MQVVSVSKRISNHLIGPGVLSVGVVLVIALAGIYLRTASASTPPILVKMVDTPATFQPEQLTIRVGETVEWKNVGNSVHHASSDPSTAVNPAEASTPSGAKPFDSGFLQPGQSFTYTFTTPGTYKYICAPHETSGMLGEVVVK